MSERKRDVFLFFSGTLFQQIVTFVTGVIVARWLGPADYGVLSLTRNVFSVILIVAPLGLDVSLLRYLAEDGDKRGGRLRQVSMLRLLVAAFSLVVLAAFAGVGPVLQAYVYRQPQFAQYVLVTFLALPLAADCAVMAAVFRALRSPVPQVVVSLFLQPFARALAIFSLLGYGFGLFGVIGGTLVGYLVSFVAFQVLFTRGAMRWAVVHWPREEVIKQELRGFLAGSIWMAFSLLVYGALRGADILLLGLSATPAAVGEYTALCAIAQIILIYPAALSQTLGPTIARYHAAGDRAAMKRALDGYLRHASLLGAPVFAGVAVFGPWLDLLFGARFQFHAGVSFWVAGGYFVSATLAPMGYSLSMTGHHRVEFYVLSFGLLLMISSGLLFVPRWGSTGIAVVVFATYLIINLARFLLVRSIHGFTLGCRRDALPPIVGLVVMLPIKLVSDAVLPHTLLSAGSAFTGALGAVALVYWRWLVDEDERRIILGVRRSILDKYWK